MPIIVQTNETTIMMVLAKGEQIMGCLQAVADTHEVGGATISGIGAVENVMLGFYDLGTQQYRKRPLQGPLELVSLTGSISRSADPKTVGFPVVHVHAALADQNFHCFGGHLFDATCFVTVEIFLSILPFTPIRMMDGNGGPPVGLSLLCGNL